MSFGIGIGDFIKVVEVADKVCDPAFSLVAA